MEKVRVGSRESVLAVTQSEMVIRHINENHPEIETELVTMKTTGDKILDRTLDKVGGKGLFVKELDRALMDDRTDLSVHSLKDMPMEVAEDLPLLGVSRREDPRDTLILPEGKTKIDFAKPIGCASNRRILQLRELFPEARFEPIRGNVQTRLRKVDEGQYAATILAAAGLKRLGLEERISRYFTTEELIPAAGQGVLAIQGRKDKDYSFLEGFLDFEAEITSTCERAFVTELDGGCTSPIAAFARVRYGRLELSGLHCDEKSNQWIRGSLSCAQTDDKEAAAELGRELARELKERLAKEEGNIYE